MLNILERIKHAEPDKRQLLENVVVAFFFQGLIYLVPLVTMPYLSRVLGVEKFGLIYFALSIISYFIIIADFGFAVSGIREVSIYRKNPTKRIEIFNSILIIKVFLMIICFVGLLCLVENVPKLKQNSWLYYYTFAWAVTDSLSVGYFFNGIEKLRIASLLGFFGNIFYIIFLFTFIKSPSDYIYVNLIKASSFLLMLVFSFGILYKNYGIRLKWQSPKTIFKYIKYSFPFFVARVFGTLQGNTNTAFLGFTASPLSVGYYVAAEKLYGVIASVLGPVNNAVYPHVAGYRNISLFKKIFLFVILLNSICCITAFIFSDTLITFFFGQEMFNAAHIFRIFTIALFFCAPIGLLGHPLLGALGYMNQLNFTSMLISTVHMLGLCALFITGHLNILNITYWVVTTQFISAFRNLFYVQKYKIFSLT